MNTALTTTSYISVSPARKAAAFKPSYKTACRIAFGINAVLAAAFLLSFPLLRIADAKCPVTPQGTPLVVPFKATQSYAEASCLRYDCILQSRKSSGKSQIVTQRCKHIRYTQYTQSSPKFQAAHQNWRFDW